MKYLLLILLLTSCIKKDNHPLCDAGKLVAREVANNIAAVLECHNQEQIRNELNDLLLSAGLCGKEMFALTDFSFKANVVCPMVAQYASSKFEETIPVNWGCKPARVIEQLNDKVKLACILALDRK